MDEYKYLKTSYINKELKNLPKPPSKDILANLNKNSLLSRIKESQKNTQKKTSSRKNQFSPLKKTTTQTKAIKGNVIKETVIFNMPNKSKGRSLEKVPSAKNIQNKTNSYYNYLDFNINKKPGMKNIFPNEKNKEKRNYVKKEKNNEENRKKNNIYNYNILNENNNLIKEEQETKYNSVCVSINNNYNYNLSLGNEHPNNENIKEKTETWQEKFNRVNKQKENMNNLDYKQLTESDFFKNKLAKKEKEEQDEKNNLLNKSENNHNFKQKIRELNSAPPPNPYEAKLKLEQNNQINENLNINNEIKNAPKKKTGILGLLQAFKDFLPNNLRKKNSTKNTNEQNNSNNIINNNNNKINVNLKLKEKQAINIPNTPKIVNNNNTYNNAYNNTYNNNSVNTTPKIRVYERKNKFIQNDEYRNNYNYNDDAYDSCPIQNNNNYNNSYTYHHKNMNRLNDDNDHQILSYSQKDIFKYNPNNNNNNIYIKGRTDLNRQYDKNKNYNYNNKTEVEQKESSLFNFFGFGKTKQANKIQENNNNLIHNFYNEEKVIPFQNPNYSTTYIKKPNQIGSNQNNNIFANYLNDLNTPKENKNKPLIKQKLLEKFNDDYNEENLEENLNINAEKKIQEIKINIRHKKDHGNKINNSAIYLNKKAYNSLDDLIMNPKPQNKIETCVINFNKNQNQNTNNTSNNIYNTPKTNYNKNIFEDNFNNDYNYNSINKYQNSYTSNKSDIYSKPYDLSQTQRNLEHNLNINDLQYNKYNTDIDNQSTNSAYTSTKPMKKKLAINKSERQFKINKTSNQDSDNTDNESNSDYSEISQTSIKSVKPSNTIYFKHFKSFFNKSKEGNSITNNFFKKIFRRDNKKYDTDSSFNSEKSDISSNSTNYNNNNLAINNITPLPSEDNYYKKNKAKEIKKKIAQNKKYFMKKIYNYNIHIPKNIKKGYYVTKYKIKIMQLPIKKVSIYTKDYLRIKQKPKIKPNYINKKRIKIKSGINLPILNKNYFFTKKNIIKYTNENIDNDFINNENININEEIKIKNQKNYFMPTSPEKNPKNIYKENSLTFSPQFGTKRESPVLNPSKSARDINKIISIEIDLKDNKAKIEQNTPNRNLSSSYNNIKLNTTGDTLYIKKKANMRIINTDDKCKTYFKNGKKLYDSYTFKNINEFNIESEPDNKNKNKKKNNIISIDIDLKEKNNLSNKINNIKLNDINYNEINNKMISILSQINPNKKNNIKLIVNNLFIIITKKSLENNNINNANQIRLPFMEILSNENSFVKIILNKIIENNNDQEKIIFYANICEQLCYKLNEEINLNNLNKTKNQIDEDLKTILVEESKIKFEQILNDNNNINNKSLFCIIIFISELIELNMISIHFGFYLYENLYNKYKTANMNKYYYLDMIIILLNKIGKFLMKEKYFYEINNFIDNELNYLVNNDMNLSLFLKNKIFELTKIKKFQWMIHNK